MWFVRKTTLNIIVILSLSYLLNSTDRDGGLIQSIM